MRRYDYTAKKAANDRSETSEKQARANHSTEIPR